MSNNAANDFDFFVIDLNGNARGKRLPNSAIDKVQKEGIKLPRSAIALDFWGQDVASNGLVFETGDSDGICLPIDSSPKLSSNNDISKLQAMMFEPDGSPFLADPRQLLIKIVNDYAELNLTPVVANELEFYLIDQRSLVNGYPKPPVSMHLGADNEVCVDGYSIDLLDRFKDFFNQLRAVCLQQNIDADTIISEMGPGQFEVNLKHVADPVLAADQTINFKRIVKELALNMDCVACFMAKPYTKESGNGFHTHFSLLDQAGNNVFDDGTDKGTDILRSAVAGLLASMTESMLIFAPHLNSYQRFQDGSHAPTSPAWGYENRTTAIRIPDSPNEARRIEHRVAGADANPYLVLAAILAGALHGIQNKLTPPQATTGDAYRQLQRGRKLPTIWQTATSAFSKSKVLKSHLGDDFIKIFAAIKRQEQAKLLSQISNIEYQAYLGRV